MTAHGFRRYNYDSYVYFKKNHEGYFMYLFLYIDNILFAARDKEEIKKVKAQLSVKLKMKDVGEAKKILGIEIMRDKKADLLYLSQMEYIEKVLQRFNIHNCKYISTPLALHFKHSTLLCPQSDGKIEYVTRVPYSSAVGSLMYVMACARPDYCMS